MSTLQHEHQEYGLRKGAEEFPLMVVISIIYPCNYGCPNCPYTDGNSEIRKFYHERKGDLFPVELWKKIADEAGPHGAWLRCTGGGEPMLHPHMVDMIEFAKEKGARVWMNTNGSMFGPLPQFRKKLERVIRANIDLIEFSMDAGDAETYAKVRPPHGGPPRNPQKWWDDVVSNVKAALELRKEYRASTRVVVSIIRQELIEGKLDAAIDFWMKEIGVDEVITRKFLSWDDNTTISLGKSLDPHLYEESAHGEEGAVRVAVRTAERRHAWTDRAVRTGRLVPDRRAVPEPQRHDDQRDLAGRPVQLVSAAASLRPGRAGVAVPQLLGVAGRRSRLAAWLAEGA